MTASSLGAFMAPRQPHPTRAYFFRKHLAKIADQLRAKPHAACLSLTKDTPSGAGGVAFGMAHGEHFATDQEPF